MRTGVCVAIIIGLLRVSAAGQETVAGEWMLTRDDQFGPNIMRLTLAVAGEKLTGTAGNRSIEGTVRGATIEFKAGTLTATGALEGAALKGQAVFPNPTLERDYKLNPSEAAMVLGFALKYDVVDLVGTQVSIAAKLPKAALANLTNR